MPKNRRRFIDKKNAVTFHLVHRSQKDPLITDETAPQHVLLETTPAQNANENEENLKKRKSEQRKFGIFYDDDYNYLQHLRSRDENNAVNWEYIPPANLKNKYDVEGVTKKESTGLHLPSSVFASEFEEDEGLLRKAAPVPGPRPELEPDIVASLDDDFDFNNPETQLEDNFMELAMGADERTKNNEEYDSDYSDFSGFDSGSYVGDADSDDDQVGPLISRGMLKLSKEETKSRFTEYSMSSSVLRRNEHLTLLDDRFDKFFGDYEEPEIGALDCAEIEGNAELSEDLLSQCLGELRKKDDDLQYDPKWDEQRIKSLQEEFDEEMIEIEVEDDPEKKWDCQSFVSTYSNAYNHPKVITEVKQKRVPKIQIHQRTGVPCNVFSGENSKLTEKSVKQLFTENLTKLNKCEGSKSLCDQSVLSTLSVLSIRPKNETNDAKRHRKRLLKDYRSERRIEKKANKDAFKEENERQKQNQQNNRNNIQKNRVL